MHAKQYHLLDYALKNANNKKFSQSARKMLARYIVTFNASKEDFAKCKAEYDRDAKTVEEKKKEVKKTAPVAKAPAKKGPAPKGKVKR